MSNTLEKDKPMNYPKRGKMSEDGKFYTHTDGSVHALVTFAGCSKCSLTHFCSTCDGLPCKPCGSLRVEKDAPMFSLVKGAYVPSDEERAACDMARAMIRMCGYFRGLAIPAQSRQSCGRCSDLSNKSCPARVFLAELHQTDAWEVKP